MAKDRGTEERATAAVSDVELEAGRVPNRIMLLPIGQLQPRDGRKPWYLKDRAHAEEVVQATRERLGNTSFMMDYDHQANRAPKVAGRAIAAGWVSPDGLHVEDDGIHADVEWTAAARDHLRNREYRYISPEFGHAKDGRITRLFTAALTNTPALEMTAVAAQSPGDDQDMTKITEQLGLAADADEDAIVNAIASLQNSTSLTAIATALNLAEDASPEDIATAASEAAARPEPVDLKPLAAALGAAEDATVEQLATAAADLKAGVVDPARYVPIETHQALQSQVEGDKEQKAVAAVDAAIEAGKIAPANRDFYLDSARRDIASFQAFVLAAPAVLKPGEEDIDAAALGATELTDEEREICSTLGVSEEDFLQTKKELA